MILEVKSADDFVTQPIWLEVSGNTLNYSPLPERLNFSQMQALRRPIKLPESGSFSCKLANLGVSAKITLALNGKRYEILVNTPARPKVLKLISGYVPSAYLADPLSMILQEISEECLIQTQHGFLGAAFNGLALPNAYPNALAYGQESFALTAIPSEYRALYQGSALKAKPRAYIHTPTASLQLVYEFTLNLPLSCKVAAFEHVDEHLENGKLVVERSTQSILYLRSSHSQCIYQYKNGHLVPVLDDELCLSEAFAPLQNWQIHQLDVPS